MHNYGKWIGATASALAVALCGCTTSSAPPAPPVPERLIFDGQLDLVNPGIGFILTHSSGLACKAHFDGNRLPESVSLPLECNDQETGTLTVAKSEDIRGSVTLSGGQSGDVTFPNNGLPVAVVAPPPLDTATPQITGGPPPIPPYKRGHASGPVYVHAYYRRGGNVRGYYRNGHYVSPHYRSGSVVHAHYRRGKR